MSTTKMIRLPQVMQRVALSRSTIYHMISQKNFPSPTRLTPRLVAWPESVIEDWLQERIQAASQTEEVQSARIG